MRLHWCDASRPVASVTAQEVIEFGERVTHHSPSMWNTMVSALRSICPLPARMLKRRPMTEREFSPLSADEFGALLAECDRLQKSKAGLVVRFLAFTGCRISEAMALTWSKVLPDRIEVSGRTTKNGRPRCVPLVPGASQVLERLRALGDSEFVLPRQSVRKGLRRACAAANLPQMCHHDFRHLFATRCIQSGVDLPTVARWLGHRDGGALLAKTYFHLADEHSRQMALKVKI